MPITKGINDLHPDSIKFIDWSDKQINSKADMMREINEALFKTKVYLMSLDWRELKKILHEKKVKGGKEHGSPRYDKYRRKKEFEDECKDLIGWNQIDKWNKKEEDNGTLSFREPLVKINE